MLVKLAAQLRGPFFMGEEVSYADLQVYHVLSNSLLLESSALDEHPDVQEFMVTVEALPGVSEYLLNRPEIVDVGVKPRLRPKT